jgi:hypothetical protein
MRDRERGQVRVTRNGSDRLSGIFYYGKLMEIAKEDKNPSLKCDTNISLSTTMHSYAYFLPAYFILNGLTSSVHINTHRVLCMIERKCSTPHVPFLVR